MALFEYKGLANMCTIVLASNSTSTIVKLQSIHSIKPSRMAQSSANELVTMPIFLEKPATHLPCQSRITSPPLALPRDLGVIVEADCNWASIVLEIL